MPTIPAKLYEAFAQIRLGKIEEGTRLFDRVDGCDSVKSAALAELNCFRHDWKHCIQFVRDFLESDEDWETVRSFMNDYTELHLKVFLLCTCHLDSWKESRSYLQQLQKKDNPYYAKQAYSDMCQKTIALISDPENTKRLLLESRPKLKEKGQTDRELLEYQATYMSAHKTSIRLWRHQIRTLDDVIHVAYLKASTEDHLTLYERYIDQLEYARSHAESAKSFIAAGNISKAKDAVRRYMRCWQHKEPLQVAPIDLFTDVELWEIMSDRRFTESLLTIPHNRES